MVLRRVDLDFCVRSGPPLGGPSARMTKTNQTQTKLRQLKKEHKHLDLHVFFFFSFGYSIVIILYHEPVVIVT